MEFCVALYSACASTKHLSVEVCIFLYHSVGVGVGDLGSVECYRGSEGGGAAIHCCQCGDCIVVSDGIAYD